MSHRSIHILGRGIIGLSAALELHRRNWHVTIVGPRETPESATRAAVGVSSVKGHLLGVKALYQAKLEGHRFLRTWLATVEQETGTIIAKTLGQVFEPFFSMTEYDGIFGRVYHREFTGALSKKRVDLFDLPPSISSAHPGMIGALQFPEDMWFDPRAALDAIESHLRRRGVGFIEHKVTRLAPGTGGWELCFEDHNVGIVPTSQIFLAAGAGSQGILERSEVRAPKMQNVWGETLVATDHPGISKPSACIRLGKTNVAFHDGTAYLGSTSYEQESQRTAARRDLVFPDNLKPEKVRFDAFCGARTRFRDRAPALGPLFSPHSKIPVWAALGFYKNGLQLGPLFAQKFANWLEFGPSFQPDLAFLFDRFS